MPIYCFECQNCDHRFESLMRPYDPVECPRCKARETETHNLGQIIRVPAVTSPHVWRGSSDGAMPKKGR